ncbi:unnamed protein product [Closterium sp. Naga37s-1]|nr:unnamed protein product [Closterium sp. Naga37s-1]
MWGHLTSSLRRLTVRSGEPHTAPDKPLIVVFGATGAQGSSVVAALLASGRYRIRAVTRHADSPRAAHLRDAKVEVAQADQADRQAVRAALDGAYGAFVVSAVRQRSSLTPRRGLFRQARTHRVTDYYSLGAREVEVGKGVVEEARGAGVQHVVWSTLPHVHRLSKGQLNVPHFTNKAQVHASRPLLSRLCSCRPLVAAAHSLLPPTRCCRPLVAAALPHASPYLQALRLCACCPTPGATPQVSLAFPTLAPTAAPSLCAVSLGHPGLAGGGGGEGERLQAPHVRHVCLLLPELRPLPPRQVNFAHFHLAREEGDGTVVFELPMAADDMLTAFDVDDTGAAVLNALDHPDEWHVSAFFSPWHHGKNQVNCSCLPICCPRVPSLLSPISLRLSLLLPHPLPLSLCLCLSRCRAPP